jgi:hypothetical protein
MDWVYLVLYNCLHFVRKVCDFPIYLCSVPRDSGGAVFPCHYRWYLVIKQNCSSIKSGFSQSKLFSVVVGYTMLAFIDDNAVKCK